MLHIICSIINSKVNTFTTGIIQTPAENKIENMRRNEIDNSGDESTFGAGASESSGCNSGESHTGDNLDHDGNGATTSSSLAKRQRMMIQKIFYRKFEMTVSMDSSEKWPNIYRVKELMDGSYKQRSGS